MTTRAATSAALIGLAAAVSASCGGRATVLPTYVPPAWARADSARVTAPPAPKPRAVPVDSVPAAHAPAPRPASKPAVRDTAAKAVARKDVPPAKREPKPAAAVTFSLDSLLRLAPGAPKADLGRIRSRGVVRAVVMPVSLGGEKPTWHEEQLADSVLGAGGLAGVLKDASGGLFHLQADIFPPLIDPSSNDSTIAVGPKAEESVASLARRVILNWSNRANLAPYDNDGPDGRPMSGDDDGAVDLAIVLLESTSFPAQVQVPLRLEVPAGRNGRLTLRVPVAYVISVAPRGSARGAMGDRERLVALLGAFGVEPGEALLPEPLKGAISTVAKVHAGWLPMATLNLEGSFRLRAADAAVRIDRQDTDTYWLVERHGRALRVSEVTTRRNGDITLSVRDVPADETLDLPIRTTGVRRPRARFTFDGDGALRVHTGVILDDLRLDRR